MRALVGAVAVGAVVTFTGCAKVAPPAAKAVVKGEQSALKSAPRLGRPGGKVAGGHAGELAPVAAGEPKSAARRWADRIERAHTAYEKANEAYDILCEIVNAPSPGSLGAFPRPASEVRPISNRRLVIDPQSGGFALPNTVGGFNFYTPDGEPLGFCAYNSAVGEMHFFDHKGVRVG